MYPEQQPPYPGEQQPYQQQPAYPVQPPQPHPGQEYQPQEYYTPYDAQPPYPPYQASPPVSAPPPASPPLPPSGVPASVPPISPSAGGYPAVAAPGGYPAVAAPGGYPAVAAPAGAAQPRRNNTPMLIITAALGLVTVVSLVLVLVTISGLHSDIADVRADLSARQAAEAQAQAKLRDDFQKADLPGKLARVQELTTAARQALVTWADSGQSSSTIKTVQDAINKCDAAVLDYDATAAKFPPELLGNLPAKIDMTNRDTDCSRIDGR